MTRRLILDRKATDLPAPHTATGCRYCGHRNGYLGHIVKHNGSLGLRWVCGRCEKLSPTDLPHKYVDPIPVWELPKMYDRSDQPSLMPGCAVCDRQAEEWHHWAPTAIFPDWDYHDWRLSTVPLCGPHHREWHDRMRALGLRWPHEAQGAA